MSAIHQMPGHLIRRLHQIHVSVFAERMRGAGLDLTSPQFGALMALSERPGIDQATLAGIVALDRPTTGGVVERLEARGLIARTPSSRDRRAKALSLTEAGLALLERAGPVVAEIQTEVLPGLTQKERATFLALAAKAAEAGNGLSRAPLVVPRAAKGR